MSGQEQQARSWAPPSTSRRSRWLTIGLPVGVLLLAGLVLVGVLVVRGFTQDVRPAQQAVDAYATALVEQRWDDAHGQLCESSAAEFTAEDLAASFGQPPLARYTVENVSVRWSNGTTAGDATVTFEADGGVRERVSLALVEEGDDWRPCP
ncbi:hypothetical protein DQ244_04615 [Blastococcus sp. TBT05-19]|uniref:Rv0361 family membrane protein n=1 Tax=Blastococcus sp. TBT05-19 TaxID=2250581 RepID=UPI000DE91ED2|nr:hypothetical protein [Blastococcus sp. TBT05-19]RBY94579.1 hypothetical protein DQ244_04615 [Blastococcus sp. TBT05-19]